MNVHLEELYLQAEADIKNNNYAEAFKKYETILYEEPANGPVLNSLGWLYKTQLEDYKKAESYYKASIKIDPTYPHPYLNYATLLLDMERFSDLAQHLETCLKVKTIDKSQVYWKFGTMEELQLKFQEAIGYYEKAILFALSDDRIKDLRHIIDRCRLKLDISNGHPDFIENRK